MNAAKTPANMPPNGTQTIVHVTARGRTREGVNSATRVVEMGSAPPIPNPAKKRNQPTEDGELERLTRQVAKPNSRTLPITAQRRPRRSASMPAHALPKLIPNKPAETAVAKALRRHAPLGGHPGNRESNQLRTQAVEDYRYGGESHDLLLQRREWAMIEYVAYVEHGELIGGGRFHSINLAKSVRRIARSSDRYFDNDR